MTIETSHRHIVIMSAPHLLSFLVGRVVRLALLVLLLATPCFAVPSYKMIVEESEVGLPSRPLVQIEAPMAIDREGNALFVVWYDSNNPMSALWRYDKQRGVELVARSDVAIGSLIPGLPPTTQLVLGASGHRCFPGLFRFSMSDAGDILLTTRISGPGITPTPDDGNCSLFDPVTGAPTRLGDDFVLLLKRRDSPWEVLARTRQLAPSNQPNEYVVSVVHQSQDIELRRNAFLNDPNGTVQFQLTLSRTSACTSGCLPFSFGIFINRQGQTTRLLRSLQPFTHYTSDVTYTERESGGHLTLSPDGNHYLIEGRNLYVGDLRQPDRLPNAVARNGSLQHFPGSFRNARILDSGKIVGAAIYDYQAPYRANVVVGSPSSTDWRVYNWESVAANGTLLDPLNPSLGRILSIYRYPPLSVDAQGNIIFVVLTSEAGPARDNQGEAVLRYNASTRALEVIASSFGSLPGIESGVTSSFYEVIFNKRGSMALRVELSSDMVLSRYAVRDQALFLYSEGSLQLVARSGFPLPGGKRPIEVMSLTPSLGVDCYNPFRADRVLAISCDNSPVLLNELDQLIFQPSRYMREDNYIDDERIPFFYSTTAGLHNLGAGRVELASHPNTPFPITLRSSNLMGSFRLSNSGRYLLPGLVDIDPSAGLFRNGLIEVRLDPTTSCPADFNSDGSATVQDIFDFLSLWFAQDTGADFNRDTTVSVQDLFDFLDAWFGGC